MGSLPVVRRTKVIEMLWAVHRWLYQKTGGRLGSRLMGAPALLLTTIGRKTGRPRVTPLIYLQDEERYIVVASYAGEPRHPAWFLNLMANRRATVQRGVTRIAVLAREATGKDRDRLWSRFLEAYGSYTAYQARTTRRIPVVVLEPTTDSPNQTA